MTTHREPDPEGDSADDKLDPWDLATTCPSCGGPLDEDGDCSEPTCPKSPYHLDEDGDGEDELPEGLLGEGDDDA